MCAVSGLMEPERVVAIGNCFDPKFAFERSIGTKGERNVLARFKNTQASALSGGAAPQSQINELLMVSWCELDHSALPPFMLCLSAGGGPPRAKKVKKIVKFFREKQNVS
jgi:hypothetical protein